MRSFVREWLCERIHSCVRACVCACMCVCVHVYVLACICGFLRVCVPAFLPIFLSSCLPPQASPRFAACFPTIKAVALAGPSQSKATKAVAKQLLPLAFAAAGETGERGGGEKRKGKGGVD